MTSKLPDGVVYVDTVLRAARGDIHRKQPVGSAERIGPGRLRLRLDRVYIGGAWIELDEPFVARVAVTPEPPP